MKKILFSLLLLCFIMLLYFGNATVYASEKLSVFQANDFMDIITSNNRSTRYDGYLDMGEYIYVNIDYISTPNGTDIEVYDTLNDFSSHLIADYDNYFDLSFPNAIRLKSASARFNCHSYAWNSQSYYNTYWMNDPSSYYLDYSYVEVTYPKVGDIVCYYDDMGTLDEGDDLNLHSGIVVSLNDTQANSVCGYSSLVNVESKWGAAGLYRHRGDECPYTSPYGGGSDYVKFYRPRTTESIELTNPNTNGTVNIEKNFNVSQSSSLQNSYVMYELNILYMKNYLFEISSQNVLDIRLYNENMNLINIDFTNFEVSSTYFTTFEVTLNVKHYYLRIAFLDENDYGNIKTDIFNQHSHNYDHSYEWESLTGHKAYCICGSYTSEAHVVPSNILLSLPATGICLLCHGKASIGQISHRSLSACPYTANGSYILPNGVILLNAYDVDYFFERKLVFIDPFTLSEYNCSFACLNKDEQEN